MNKKILIVEDDPMLVEIYEKKFSKDGFSVKTASSGSKARKIISTFDPDMVLLDLVLPEEDGFEVLKKIKENPKTKKVRVVVFSNLSQDEDKEKASVLGAEGFITKSDFTPQQIVDEVRKLFEKEETEDVLDESEQIEEKANGRKKILIIEDEEVFVEVFSTKLKEAGYKVEVAKNGAWGLKKSNEKVYDMLIIDIVMPAMDGIELVKKIKEGKRNKKTPIIVFSNSVNEDKILKEIKKLKVNKFLVKTRITPSDLIKEVDVLLV